MEKLDSHKKVCQLVVSGAFLSGNICYILFLEIVEWYSKDSSTQMRYNHNETLQIVHTGYRMFKGKFLRLMCGPKSIGILIDGCEESWNFNPMKFCIFFVVLSVQNLMNTNTSSNNEHLVIYYKLF